MGYSALSATCLRCWGVGFTTARAPRGDPKKTPVECKGLQIGPVIHKWGWRAAVRVDFRECTKSTKAAGRNEVSVVRGALGTTRPLQLCISMKPPSLGRRGGRWRKKRRTKREGERGTERQREEGNRHAGSCRGTLENSGVGVGKGSRAAAAALGTTRRGCGKRNNIRKGKIGQ